MLNVDLERLKKVVKDFYNITGMLIVFYDDKRNKLCSYPEQMFNFCKEVRKKHKLEQMCFDCDNNGFDICDQTKEIYIYKCHMGLTEVISPICENGIIIGYIMFGQTYDIKDKASIIMKLNKKAELYKLDLEVMINELNNMPVADKNSIVSLADIMEMCACYLWLNQIIIVRTDSLTHHLCNYISEHLADDLSLKTLCTYLNISKSTLYKLSTAYFHMGISDYIRHKRFEKAKQLLMDSSFSISEVAAKSGIGDANYFTKLFKKLTGKTPREHRKICNLS